MSTHLGAEIFCKVWVSDIQEMDDGKWQLNCKYAGDSSTSPHNFSVTADIVILGAGSLGSTEILLRSKDKHSLTVSNMCGKRFGGKINNIHIL
jgi:cholesterol oxidase